MRNLTENYFYVDDTSSLVDSMLSWASGTIDEGNWELGLDLRYSQRT